MKMIQTIHKYQLFCWLIIFPLLLNGQIDSPMPRLVIEDVNDMEIIDENIYWGTDVFDHIAGKKDIYSQLHFDSLLVQDIILDKEKYQIGVFRLESKEEAFEVYGMNKSDCRDEQHTGPATCVSAYRVLSQTGLYVISVTNYTGSEMSIWISLQLSKIISKKTEEAKH